MGVVILTPPRSEPVSLDEAKAHLNVDHDDDDDLIKRLIGAARRLVEGETNRALVPRLLRADFDGFPAGRCDIRLAGQVLRIDAVAYVDNGDTVTLLAGTDYVTDLSADVARVCLPAGGCWPWVCRQAGAVSVTYVAGYGSVPDDYPTTPAKADVPSDAVAAILLLVGDMYDNRGSDTPRPRAAQALIDSLAIEILA